MYKVLIVDDEPLIVKGLSELIDWESLGCTICGTAMNGIEGRKKIEELKPDITISDIVMSGYTGLELAEYVYQEDTDIILILLSGYDEFEFAKEALKYGVFDYLLKPTDKDEVIKVIKKAVKRIEKTRISLENYEWMESAFQESIPIIEQSLLHDIVVKGIINTQNVSRKIDQLQLTIGQGAIMIVERIKEIEDERIFQSITTSIEKVFYSENLQVRFIVDNLQLILIPSVSTKLPSKVAENRLREIAISILNHLQFQYNLTISIGIGSIFTTINSIHHSYEQANLALLNSFFEGQGKVYIYEDRIIKKSIDNFPIRLTRFIEHFEEWNDEEIHDELQILFRKLEFIHDKQVVINYSLELIIKLSLVVARWDQNFAIQMEYDHLQSCKSFKDLQKFITQTCMEFKQHLHENMLKNNLGITEKTKRMIDHQYSNPDLNAQYIADELEVNVSYLSRTFKKETNKNLSIYIAEKRIQVAQRLLKTTDLKTNEVAKRVGFTDARYFGQVFKKIIKITPSEYRKLSSQNIPQ